MAEHDGIPIVDCNNACDLHYHTTLAGRSTVHRRTLTLFYNLCVLGVNFNQMYINYVFINIWRFFVFWYYKVIQ